MNSDKHKFGLMSFLLLVALASGGDLLTDLSHGASRQHLAQEAILLVLALLFLTWLLWDRYQRQRQISDLRASLEEIRTFAAPQSDEVAAARHRLGEVIISQFQQWQLTPSEQEVGLLLLKGYSTREIAILRGTAEKTVRQQASSIYQKSGVSGRHTFSAWFIEDLL